MHRLLFLAALIAGASYWASDLVMADGAAKIAWKGAGVGLLAIWAAAQARDRDGWLLAAVLGFGALGDVLLDAISLEVGALAFLAGHLLAVWLYARNPGRYGRRDVAFACVVLVATPVLAASLTDDRAAVAGIAIYALGLGAMAASAWLSCYPRSVAVGALLFVASDLLIFAKGGPLAQSFLPALLVWPLYFAGQTLIAHGVGNYGRAR